MAYNLSVNKNTLTLQLTDTVDMSQTNQIKEGLTNEPKSGMDKLVVDGSKIEYLDSSAVALLIFAKRLAADHGMSCEFSASEEAFKVIQMAGLQSVLDVKKASDQSSTAETASDGHDLNLDDLDIDFGSLDTVATKSLDTGTSIPVKSDEDKNGSGSNDDGTIDIKPGNFS
ncbi:MAG: STAS domain-containing protein [Burkholderiales bacterium]|jgi:anti-anti-sigma factor|nr:STAS domain-containing protein [Burkholderiales bacterium]|tara:strand:+ start:6975 stop:7487 length:513 start_codon:yes stop_codon:yes gene_type:complete